MWRRFLTSNDDNDEHHNSIYQRQVYEQMRPRKPPGDMWGTARDNAVDIDRMYEQYRRRTAGCNCAEGP
jgi:hypothetical protein